MTMSRNLSFADHADAPPYYPTLATMIMRAAEQWPDREAIVAGEHRLTFTQLESESGQLARGLLDQGCVKGTRVALLMPNGPDWSIAFFACARIGAVVTPLSTLFRAPELAWALKHSNSSFLLTVDHYKRHDYLSRIEEAFPALAYAARKIAIADAPFLRAVYVWGEANRKWARPADELRLPSVDPQRSAALLRAAEAEVTPSDPAFVIYTSGSTAEPKAVMHAHGPAVRHSYMFGRECWPVFEGDRVYSTRPFFWIGGLVGMLFYSLQVGACLVTGGTGEPADILELLATERLTALAGREPWLHALMASPLLADRPQRLIRIAFDVLGVADLVNGQLCFRSDRTEAMLPAGCAETPRELFPRTIGMTETLGALFTERALTALPADKAWSCGRIAPHMQYRLRDPVNDAPTPVNEVGELLVRGGSLMLGYYKRERSDVLEEDGFYATGDLCRIDQDGYLYFSSRRGDMLKIKGANVAPAEVEDALMALPQVQEAAVVGMPTADGDSLLAAAIVIKRGATVTEEVIAQLLKTRLSSFKIPRLYGFYTAEDLPRTGSGKVHREKLAQKLSELLEGHSVAAAGAARDHLRIHNGGPQT